MHFIIVNNSSRSASSVRGGGEDILFIHEIDLSLRVSVSVARSRRQTIFRYYAYALHLFNSSNSSFSYLWVEARQDFSFSLLFIQCSDKYSHTLHWPPVVRMPCHRCVDISVEHPVLVFMNEYYYFQWQKIHFLARHSILFLAFFSLCSATAAALYSKQFFSSIFFSMNIY